MEEIFENVDFQVIFVVIAVIIAALQAFAEKRKKKRAEEELLEDVGRRVTDRRDGAGGQPSGPAGDQDFGDLYEEYRRQIAEDQRRSPSQEETHTAPWQPPRAEPVPPPLPPSPPPRPKPAPARWQPPKVKRAADRLNPEEQAALKALEQRKSTRKSHRRGRSSSARQLLRDPNGRRRAIVLREIIGPPKGR